MFRAAKQIHSSFSYSLFTYTNSDDLIMTPNIYYPNGKLNISVMKIKIFKNI